jgi:hypothetical protein
MTPLKVCPRPAPNWRRMVASGGIQWQMGPRRRTGVVTGQTGVLTGVRGAPGRIRTCGTRFSLDLSSGRSGRVATRPAFVFGVWPCRWPSCRAGWAGVHGPGWCPFLFGWWVGAGHGAGRACSRVIAVVIRSAHPHREDSRSRRRLPPLTRRPAVEKTLSRRRLGSQRRAGWSCRARSWVQAVRSWARATSSSQSWFWAVPWSGRLRSPVS